MADDTKGEIPPPWTLTLVVCDLVQPGGNNAERDIVRHQIAAIEISLGENAELGFGADRCPESVSCREVVQVQGGRQSLRLGAFACTLGAHQNDMLSRDHD